MLKKFLTTQTHSISFATAILAFFYVCSAGLGLLRDHLLAGKFGAGNELDVYYAAFTIPDLIALLLVFGAVSAAIIPMFTNFLSQQEDDAWDYATNLLNVFLMCLIVVCGILMLFSPWLIKLIAPGFSPEKQAECAMLMRIMFLSPIILGISNIISGILQVFHRFLVTAVAPLMYNLGIILGIVFFVPAFGLIGLAFGVVLGGVLHLCIQLPAFWYSGFRYKPLFGFKHPGVKKTLILMIPRSLGLGAGQLNTIATTAIASTLLAGSVAMFNLANNVSNMLITATAASLSTAIFPALSRAHSQGATTEFERKFSSAFLQQLFVMVPAAVLLFFLRAQITRLVWGSGKFDWTDTRLTAACLGIFAIGLCFQGMVFLLSKTFYATHNTKIPAIVSALTVAFNIAMSLLFVFTINAQGAFYDFVAWGLRLQGIEHIGVTGLALAYSLTGLVEALLLLGLLYYHYRTFRLKVVGLHILKILTAAAIAGVVTWLVRDQLVHFNVVQLETSLGVFIQLLASAAAGSAAYLGVAFFLQLPELTRLKGLIFRR